MNPLPLAVLALLAFPPSVQAGQTAQTTATDVATTTTTAEALDLAVPNEPIRYRSETGYAGDPPGTWYGDTSGRPASPTAATPAGETDTTASTCEGRLHGAVTAGFGYARHGGNLNWQAANLNRCQTYYDDDGNARQFGFSISVGRSDGPGWHRPGL